MFFLCFIATCLLCLILIINFLLVKLNLFILVLIKELFPPLDETLFFIRGWVTTFAATEMSQLYCGGCRTLLMYARGATSVRCSCCDTINVARSSGILIHGTLPWFWDLLLLYRTFIVFPVVSVLESKEFFLKFWHSISTSQFYDDNST